VPALRFGFKAHGTVASLIHEYRQIPSKLLNPRSCLAECSKRCEEP
jgi:hypothetical protein